jgi:hypothetical protein
VPVTDSYIPVIAKENAHLQVLVVWLDDYEEHSVLLLKAAYALQRANNENSTQIFPEKELRDHSPNFYIQVSVSDLYFPKIDLPYSAAGNMWNRSWEYTNRSQTHECGNWD